MTRRLTPLFVAVGITLGAADSSAQEAAPASNQNTKAESGASAVTAASERPGLTKADGLVMLDYEVIPVPSGKSIDLLGFHFFSKMNDWLYLGVGGYAPLVKGEYGGFMAIDVTAHAQYRMFGNLLADAGVSLGGGGGGKSVEQSKILTGSGGFVKGYLGLSYDFGVLALGVNISRMKFFDSAIAHTQPNIFIQVPFSYSVGAYASSGSKLASVDDPDAQKIFMDARENMLSLGLDNYAQINPEGSSKDTINAADLQFSHFMTRSSYWYVDVGVGYHGLPLYNQILGGLGYRVRISPGVNFYSQLGIGSGGYSSERINTGAGLLVYPKVFGEYMFAKDFGLALSAGYLTAPKGSSRNYTFGASLNYHIHPDNAGSAASLAAEGIFLRGYRVNVFQQTELSVTDRGAAASNISMLSAQLDNVVSDHLYIPVQISVAYNAYLGYPGYGELLAGVGAQTKYDKDNRFQAFGQLLLGTNSHGPIVKPGVGLNFGLSDRLAIYGLAGRTYSTEKDKFRADYVGLGLSYRFSVPVW
jgi:hypothetical protein